MQTIEPKVGEATLAALHASQSPPTEVLLTSLLNDLTTLGDVVLVLDDYHVIESQPIDDALTFFVDHLPPQCGWSLPAERIRHSRWPGCARAAS